MFYCKNLVYTVKKSYKIVHQLSTVFIVDETSTKQLIIEYLKVTFQLHHQ